MLGQRWPNIEPSLGLCIAFTAWDGDKAVIYLSLWAPGLLFERADIEGRHCGRTKTGTG